MLSEDYKNRLKELSGLKLEFDFKFRPQRLSHLDNDDKYMYHVTSPAIRKSILKQGLIPMTGERREGHEFLDGKPAIFVSKNIKNLFLGGQGDVWKIDTTKTNNTWHKDGNYASDMYYTLTPISLSAIELLS